jgi:hypothetical protein
MIHLINMILILFLLINPAHAFEINSNSVPQEIESTYTISPTGEFKYSLEIPGGQSTSSSSSKIDFGDIFSLDGCNVDKSLGLRFFLEANQGSNCQIKDINNHRLAELSFFLDSEMDINGGNKLNVSIQPILEEAVPGELIGNVFHMEVSALSQNFVLLNGDTGSPLEGNLSTSIDVPYSYSSDVDHTLKKKYKVLVRVPLSGKHVEKTLRYKLIYNFTVDSL